jgi:processive 1,2-diacylglycerol beta-glucosyltransferase
MGFGHKTAAEALCEWCHALFPASATMCRDVLDYVPKLMRGSIVSCYNAMMSKTPWMWDRMYKNTEAASGRHPVSMLWNDLHKSMSKTWMKHLFAEMDRLKPQAVFSTHYLGMSALLDKWEHEIPIYFVGTDYLSHSLQRDPRFSGWFVGSEEAARQHRADAVPTSEHSVKNFGIPISRDYLVPPTRSEARRMLQVDEARRMATVIGGGVGASVLDDVAGSLIDLPDWKIAIICRDNKRAFERLRDKYFPFRHITVTDSVPNVADYYAASDVVVMNPNGVQMAEASTAGAAMLLLDPLPGAERDNCDYALERGAARKIYENRRVGELLGELMGQKDELSAMKFRARRLSRPNAAMDILTWAMDKPEKRES